MTLPEQITLPPGFKAELLYRVPKLAQGSWVAMTVDGEGRLLCGDQYGDVFRITPPPLGASDPESETRVEPLETGLKGIQGLLYAFESLYVMINEGPQPGVHRLRDTQHSGRFDQHDYLVPLEKSGEHGPHSLQLSPDGKSVYFNGGNSTRLPADLEHFRGAKAWGEDHLLPRLWDPNGHSKGLLAPGGFLARMDPDGRHVEVVGYGYRNQFDFAFNSHGDLFTYDADMEWDLGTPWYRPTRFNHALSGGDAGWRSGAGKWPAYYADSIPLLVDIGPGSPTGVCAGTGAKFPAKYQRAIFGNDWTYGTMYAIHLTPQGASYQAQKEEFLSGKSLPLTDLLIRPQDGAMYFTTGGRRSQSALYRVTYAGPESTAPVAIESLPPEGALRRDLEALHADGTGPEALEKAWPHLASPDRALRYAARVAIEKQPASVWAGRALEEKRPAASIEALIALARVGDASLLPQLISALSRLDYRQLGSDLRLPLLRAWQLAFIRMGKPAAAVCESVRESLDPLFPLQDPLENRELLQLLVFLDSPTVVSKAVSLLQTLGDDHEEISSDALTQRNAFKGSMVSAFKASRPNKQQIAFAYTLRNATAGWSPELRKEFFRWFPKTATWKGGNSLSKFLQTIRAEALAKVSDPTEKRALDRLSQEPPPAMAHFVPAKGPGKAYSVDDLVQLTQAGLRGRHFEQGKAMYATAQCATCHQFAGEGGHIGPDLTGAGSRYTVRDLAESIIEPSKVISDQYAFQQITKKDGSLVIGRVLAEESGAYSVMTNPFAPEASMQVPVHDVASRKDYPVSPMPPGLVNMLNEDELLDLVAYLLSGGNPKDKAFTTNP